jgi:membrane-anchored glycerophosphoryl diester phosphodiesterase (GDPDase)
MKKKLLSGLLVLAFVFTFVAVPVALAQDSSLLTTSGSGGCDYYQNEPVTRLICKIGLALNQVIPILITLGVVYFIWGVLSYAIAKDEEAKTKGRGAMINGIIALAVIVSIWGLVNILKTFALGNNQYQTDVQVPCVGVGCTTGGN